MSFAWLESNYDRVRHMALKMTKGFEDRQELLDEMMSEATDRMPRICELYDERKGPFENYARNALRWYMFKRRNAVVHARSERGCVHEDHGETQDLSKLCQDMSDAPFEEEMRELLTRVESELSEYDYWLLYTRFADGLSVLDIANHIGISRSLCAKHIAIALSNAKAVLHVA